MAFKDPEKRRAYMRQYAADKRNKHRQIIRAAKAVPCADCTIQYKYYQMTFDHLEDKNFNIGTYAQNPSCSTRKLIDEIAKCDVVCFNCHAERTHQRAVLAGQRIEDIPTLTERLPPPSERTHCPQGHEYTSENTKRGSKGERICRICARAATNAWEKRHMRVGHGKGRSGKRIPKEIAV